MKIGNFRPANLSFNIRNSEGYSDIYEANKFFDSSFEKYQKRYFANEPDWFTKLLKCYLSNQLFQKVIFIKMVEAKIRCLDTNIRHEIYIVPHMAIRVFAECYKAKGLSVKQSYDLISYIKPILSLIRDLLKIIYCQFTLKTFKSNISNIRSSVWIEYYVTEITPRRLNGWLDYLKQRNFDIVYYFDRPDAPVSEKSKHFGDKKGYKWIDLKNLHAIHWSWSDYIELVKKLLILDRKDPIWFHFFKLKYFILYTEYRLIFKKFQVKALFQHREVSWIQGLQARALKSVGGIMIGFQWSSYVYGLETSFLIPQHVYFVWGKTNFDFIQDKGLTSQYVLASGESLLLDVEEKDLLKEFSNRFEFTLSIFDSSVSYNLYQDPTTMVEFYLVLIDLLEHNPNWGGIVKSKGYDLDSLPKLPNGKILSSRMRLLVSQGRLLLHNSLTFPLDVALSTDISVSYGVNSAGIIAGIGGSRSIHWDCSGLLHHPIYEDKDQEIIYSTLSGLKGAILKVSVGNQTIGDFSKWRQIFNHFDDFLGPQRIARFVRSFMEEVIQTNNTGHSLKFAVEIYNKENKTENWLLES
jgi:hypothetical protein